jgi:hypothetical protein
MKILTYKLILWWLGWQLGHAENAMDGARVDRLVNAMDMIRGEIHAAR